MSQHLFRSKTGAGLPVDVLCGWDRPLQGFFLVIEETEGDVDEPLFSNLDQPISHPPTFAPWLAVLQRTGITIPDSLLANLAGDQRDNVGGHVTRYEAG